MERRIRFELTIAPRRYDVPLSDLTLAGSHALHFSQKSRCCLYYRIRSVNAQQRRNHCIWMLGIPLHQILVVDLRSNNPLDGQTAVPVLESVLSIFDAVVR